MDNEKAIKVQLVALAEYMQTSLTDAQVKLYYAEMREIRPEVLAMAISALKQDSELWSGRFPLPAKIKSYIHGSVDDLSTRIVMNIFRAVDTYAPSKVREAYEILSSDEKQVLKTFGWSNLCNMMVGQRTFYFTQMKSVARSLITQRLQPKLGISSNALATLLEDLPNGERGIPALEDQNEAFRED